MNERDSNLPDDSGDEPADWLGAWVVPEARAEFRAGLRDAFVQGNFGAPSVADDDGHISALEEELGPYLEQVAAPPARQPFVRDLREEFVAGRSAVPTPRPIRRAQRVPRRARSLSMRWRLVTGGLLAAAAAVLLLSRPKIVVPTPGVPAPGDPVTPVALAQPVAWAAVPGVDLVASGLTIDGESVVGLDARQAEDKLRTATAIVTGGEAARFVMGEYFVLELAANSSIELLENSQLTQDGAPDAGFGHPEARRFILRGDQGAVRVATGPSFPGSRMTVEAPFMEVDVVGTIFGIDVFKGQATCLCCAEGTVEVRPLVDGHEHSQEIEAGASELVGPGFANSKPIADEHLAPLEQLALYWD